MLRTDYNSAVHLRGAFASIWSGLGYLAPKTPMSIAEHSEKNRFLYSGPSEKKGNFVLYPHQRIILSLGTMQQYRRVTVVASLQIGKTEMILCIFTYYVDQDPLPQMIVFDTLVPAAQNFSLGRIDSAIKDTPCLRGKFMDVEKKKKSGNTKFRKDYPGGPLILAGANSVSSLSGNPVAVVMLDEVDKYKLSKAGFSSDLAFGRTTSFTLKGKMFAFSSPAIDGSSEIWEMYEQSNQGVLQVVCPHCSVPEEFIFSEQTFRYSVRQDVNGRKIVKEAWYQCPHCDGRIDERERMVMIANEVPYFKNPEVTDHLGMRVWAMYNPDIKMSRIAQDYLDTFDKIGNVIPEKRKTFVNQVLGLPYKETSSSRDANSYTEKVEEYSLPDERMIKVTVAVDVQKKYFQYRYVGWGYMEEPYILGGGKIEGDTTRTDTLSRLYDVLTKPVVYANGYEERVYAMGIDANYNSEKVHMLIKRLQTNGFNAFATIGRSYPKLPAMIKSVYNHKKYRTRLAYMNIERLADTINNFLEPFVTEANGVKVSTLGIHFSEVHCTPEFFEQFFSEHRVEVKVRGKVDHYKWEIKKLGLRNEEADLMRINLALIKLMEPLNWDRLKKSFELRMKNYELMKKEHPERVNEKRVKKTVRRVGRDPFTSGYKP